MKNCEHDLTVCEQDSDCNCVLHEVSNCLNGFCRCVTVLKPMTERL